MATLGNCARSFELNRACVWARSPREVEAHRYSSHPFLSGCVAAADEVIAGKLDSEFPLYVWQTGSGTQSNMNVNEVIGNRASQLLGGELGTKTPVHPNNHVNMGQSSNDTFPTAMHIATLLEIGRHTLPHLGNLTDSVWAKAVEWVEVVKIGRTHLQDAVPLTVGQAWSGRATQLLDARYRLETATHAVYELAAGGTAVGTGLNAPPGFGKQIAELAELTGLPLKTAKNKFAAQGSLDGMVAVSAGLAASQQEATVMVCLQVIGEDLIVASAGAQGNFELNAMRPIIISNVLHSARILGDMCEKLRTFSVEGTKLDQDKVTEYVGRSLMLVTALSPHIGYDNASAIAHKADDEGTSLREAALALRVSATDFDRIVNPKTMVGNPRRDLGLQ